MAGFIEDFVRGQSVLLPDRLTGKLVPDHRTISDSRRDKGGCICKICAQFAELCCGIGTLSRPDAATRCLQPGHRQPLVRNNTSPGRTRKKTNFHKPHHKRWFCHHLALRSERVLDS